jgi:hypothetical protein
VADPEISKRGMRSRKGGAPPEITKTKKQKTKQKQKNKKKNKKQKSRTLDLKS